MNGKKIENTVIESLLVLADWAPTHARTEPWRFVVYSGDAVRRFCADHAALYQTYTAEDKFTTAKYEGVLHNGDKASHIVAAYMKRAEGAKIPVVEDVAATAAAIQNILLGAASLGIAALWSTGGMTHQPAMKDYFRLKEEDQMMGLIYLGYSDLPVKEGKRNTPLSEKVSWNPS